MCRMLCFSKRLIGTVCMVVNILCLCCYLVYISICLFTHTNQYVIVIIFMCFILFFRVVFSLIIKYCYLCILCKCCLFVYFVVLYNSQSKSNLNIYVYHNNTFIINSFISKTTIDMVHYKAI